MSVPTTVKEALSSKIAGEIILSRNPGVTMRKWRELFNVSQVKLAEEMGISPSVISDYESGRRKSPGTQFVRRFVEALITIDEAAGGHLLHELSRIAGIPTEAILDVREFPVPVSAQKICETIQGTVLACPHLLNRNIYGYTVLDSPKAVVTLSGMDFMQIFGTTTERVLIFTNVTRGRSPMVAVRVTPLKPRMIVLHGPKEVDSLGVKLAEIEQIPLVLSNMKTTNDLIASLKELYQSMVSK